MERAVKRGICRRLATAFEIGRMHVANRVVLAPMAGVGNWFVRLQARRHGAGMVFSEMVSSSGVHHGNKRTLTEFLRIHPDEHPVAVQLYGSSADVMASAAETAVDAGADVIDINMGCPVRKVVRRGAGAALLGDPERAVAITDAVRRAGGVPVTVKLRSGLSYRGLEGVVLARRLAEEAGVAAVTIHPRPAENRRGAPLDYELARRLVSELDVPVLVSGGLTAADRARHVFAYTGCAAVMLARGAVGNPWLFGEVLGEAGAPPEPQEVVDEMLWLVDRAVEHWGERKSAHWLRQLYPGYLKRLRVQSSPAASALMRAGSVAEAREAIAQLCLAEAA